MSFILAKFGIDEIYFHEGLLYEILEKIYQRACLSLDAYDPINRKYVSHDIILIFYKQVPSQSVIYRFLKHLDQDINKDTFIKDNTLINQEDIFQAIKSKDFVLVTHRHLTKDKTDGT